MLEVCKRQKTTTEHVALTSHCTICSHTHVVSHLCHWCLRQMWIEFGRIHLPQGHHPNDVEKEWGKLIVAMLEREKSLRPEVERYA